MAFPTALTNQTSAQIANLDAGVVGNSPAIAMSNYYLSTSTALSQAALNATHQQQASWRAENLMTMNLIGDMRFLNALLIADAINDNVFA